jgi:hypothetical protein
MLSLEPQGGRNRFHGGFVRNVLSALSSTYTQVVTVIRLTAILLVTSLVGGQEFSSPKIGQSNTPLPKLPVINYEACPGKGKTVLNVKISQDDQIHRLWQGNGKSIGKLKAGEEVTVLGGLNVILEPDRAVIKYVGPGAPSALKVGDVALGYGIEPDDTGGDIVFWSKGTWFAEWEEAVAEKSHCGFTSGFGQGGCEIDIIKDGVSEWWVQVKTSSGVTGWVLAEKFNGDKHWYGNFSDLCHYGED